MIPSREAVEDFHASSAESFLEILSPRNDLWSANPAAWIYRGHANAEWTLKPRAVRDLGEFDRFGVGNYITHPGAGTTDEPTWSQRRTKIQRMLERFRDGLDRSGLVIPAESPKLKPTDFNHRQDADEPPREALPLMALAQHHGLPTIFLDWTRRAWIAAYFAAVEAADPEKRRTASHLAVWALLRNGQTAPSEGPHFHEAPAGTNPNMSAQAGLFTTHFSERDLSIEEHFANLTKVIGGSPPLRRLTLPVSEAPKLLRLLSYEGIDGASMFPGADGVVRAMREERLWDRTAPDPNHGRFLARPKSK